MPEATKDSTSNRVVRLECQPNQYPWGKVGNDSLAEVFAKNAGGENFELDPSSPHGWVLTRRIRPRSGGTDNPLSSYLAEHLDFLGSASKFPPPFPADKKDNQAERGTYPSSSRSSSANKIYPDKALAEKLHKQNPEQFPDTNHKPEIAVAVCLGDRFLGFAGFRQHDVIRDFLLPTPEIQMLPQGVRDSVKGFIGKHPDADVTGDQLDLGSNPDQVYLKACWGEFIGMEGKDVEKAVEAFTDGVAKQGVEAFSAVGVALEEQEKKNIVEAAGVLDQYYPGGGSTFACICFMSLLELKRGEGLYVGADGPHAWLTREIVELMAASDNVLNVGFTPDKDSTRLVAKAVTATAKSPSELILRRQPYSKGKLGNTVVYSTPFEEFSIVKTTDTEALAPLDGPGIAIVTKAEGTTIWDRKDRQALDEASVRSVYFVAAGTELGIKGEGEVWMAFYDGDKESSGQVGKQ